MLIFHFPSNWRSWRKQRNQTWRRAGRARSLTDAISISRWTSEIFALHNLFKSRLKPIMGWTRRNDKSDDAARFWLQSSTVKCSCGGWEQHQLTASLLEGFQPCDLHSRGHEIMNIYSADAQRQCLFFCLLIISSDTRGFISAGHFPSETKATEVAPGGEGQVDGFCKDAATRLRGCTSFHGLFIRRRMCESVGSVIIPRG